MGNFIQEKAFRRFFHPEGEFGIVNFGYDDFAFMKAAEYFRVQNYYTWHFVISGKGHLEIDGGSYDLSAGDSFFLPPEVPMRYFPDPKDPWEYVWFAFKGRDASRYGEELSFSTGAPVRPCGHFSRVKQILTRTIDDLRANDHGYYRVMSAFYELLDLSLSPRRPKAPIQAIRQLIDEGYTMPDFSIEQLCRDVCFSHAQLLRLFKEEYGRTVRRYLIEKRLAYACELLENSDMPVCSVALSCGFSDEIHFMKSFKKQYGMTATEYRKSAK